DPGTAQVQPVARVRVHRIPDQLDGRRPAGRDSPGVAAARRHHGGRGYPSDDPVVAWLGGEHPYGRHSLRRPRITDERAMIATLRSLLYGSIVSGTPLLYATVAEVIDERAGCGERR